MLSNGIKYDWVHPTHSQGAKGEVVPLGVGVSCSPYFLYRLAENEFYALSLPFSSP